MKASFLTMMLCCASLLSFAQATCDSIKKENIYLRKALNLNEPIKEAKKGDLSYAIVKVTGDSKAQTVTVEILIKNSGKNLESFGSQVNSISDLNGNTYRLDAAYAGDERVFGSMFVNLFRDAPLKCRYIFKGIEPEVKMIKLFNFPVKYHVPGTNSFDFVEESVEFRDFSINWK
jgi:hypothetical protein